jgi:hypothetical protein
LQHNRVAQWATKGKLPDIYKFVAKTIRETIDKINPATLTKVLNEKLNDLKALLQKIRPIVPSTIREHIDDFVKYIDSQGRAMSRAVAQFVEPVRTVLKVVAKKLDDHAWRVEVYRTNRGWIAPISESGSAKLINAKPPKWAKKFKGRLEHPRLQMTDDELRDLLKTHPNQPQIDENTVRTFSRHGGVRPDSIEGPAKLYRIIDPSNEGAGVFWISEAEFKDEVCG